MDSTFIETGHSSRHVNADPVNQQQHHLLTSHPLSLKGNRVRVRQCPVTPLRSGESNPTEATERQLRSQTNLVVDQRLSYPGRFIGSPYWAELSTPGLFWQFPRHLLHSLTSLGTHPQPVSFWPHITSARASFPYPFKGVYVY